ncbi:hypothetical protein HO173_006765 [Letharia columbiana]|uniref:NACHT domain-containing protein n=1 Tax=Letharia columbiana TaxID=112416 RepID=A0A8H6L4F3_9LECA|nr:uncharacterized protein HO173_006765 [Letharia columbiana]KAF6235136.1 hypothetical protein HO173_006765 [Letharia columbiana]
MSCLYGNRVKEDEYELLLQTLEPHGRNSRRYSISQAHQESFQWIWDTQNSRPGFSKWLRSEDPIFWISGKPGAGKSTLMRYLMESEQTMHLFSGKPDAMILVHYFFHELGESQEKSFGGLLHAIVYQLLIGLHKKNQGTLFRLCELLKPHLCRNPTSKAALSDYVLMTILQKVVAECKETLRVCLFIDGFDECQGDHREQLDSLTDWVRSSSNKKLSVRACIASRVEMEIELRLSNEPTFAIHHFTKHDISTYVTTKLRRAWDLMAQQRDGTTAKYDQKLVDRVVKKAEGVFVWVTIVVSQLVVAIEEENESHDLYESLADLPEGLEQLYASVIDKIDQRYRHDTVNFLSLIQKSSHLNSSARADTLLKFSAAIQDPMSAISCKAYLETGFTTDDAGLPHHQCAQVRRRLQRRCRGLIEIEDAEDLPGARVAFLHRTVKEYVTGSQLFERTLDEVDSKLLRNPAVALMAMNLRLVKVYPEYVESHNISMEAQSRDEVRDLRVCGFFFAARAAQFSIGSSQIPYVEELDRVLSLSYPDWTNSHYGWRIHKARPDWNTDLLSLAVSYDLALYVHQQIRKNGKGIIEKAHGRPLLFYAFDALSLNRYNPGVNTFHSCEVLLENDADPMENFKSHTPWSFAILVLGRYMASPPYQLHIGKLFTLMLEHGADPFQPVDHNIDDWWWFKHFKKLYSTVFHVALYSMEQWKYIFRPILRLLVDHCNDFEATDSDGIGIQDWADSLNPEIGTFLGQEIAAKRTHKRRRRH